MIVWLYDRWGNQIDCIGDVIEMQFDDEVNAIDSLTITLPFKDIIKGNRLLWRDEWGEWHEQIVSKVETLHLNDSPYQVVYGENSLVELNTNYKDEVRCRGYSNTLSLTRLVDGTRWVVGKTDNLGNADITYYHCTAFEGLTKFIDTYGGEFTTSVTVGANGVTSRKINHIKQRGEDNGLLFTYGYDMDGIQRSVDLDEVVTRLHCFGKGQQAENEEEQVNPRRLTFSSINGGKDYLDNDDALNKWGVLDSSGKVQHAEGYYIAEDCEDVGELLELGKAELARVSEPRVTYTANVMLLEAAGMDYKNARVGDVVYMRDEPLDERLNGRVTHIIRYVVGNKPATVTIGNVVRNISNVFQDQQKAIGSLQGRSNSWDNAATAGKAWLDNLINSLNDAFNAGGAYYYQSFELGSIWSSVPLAKDAEGKILPRPSTLIDEDGNPAMAIQLKGGGFRIANKVTSTGDFNWRTFGTGEGFTADYIRAGRIEDTIGANWWDLETGELRMSTGAMVGDKTISDFVSDPINDFVSSVYDPKIADLQKQIDGQIETWYYDYEPKLTNKPASDWNTEAKKAAHEGDLFYWKSKGYAYRFFKDGNSWVWQMVQDTDITKAMAAAAEAQDTADEKRRVFVSQPKPPYDIGDLWVQGSTGDILRSAVARTSGNYVAGDWIKASKYTDDSALTAFMAGEFADTIKDIEGQIDGKAETWYQTTDPSTAWKTTDDKNEHKGDLWFNSNTGVVKRWSGTAWVEMDVQPPQEVFDKIDGKAQIFITQPKPPYYVGDLYFKDASSDILTCITTRTTGNYTASDWQKRNKYIDQSAADNTAKSAAEAAIKAQTQEDIFNKLTNNGALQGIYIEGNKLYINATYIRSGIITSSGGSHWNMDTGEFETICTLSSTQTSDTTTYTRYTDKVIVVDMTASVPFSISSGSRTRTEYKDGRDTVYGSVTSKSFIGGIETTGDEVYFRASRVGISSTNYITTGQTSDGYKGASFVADGGDFLKIASLRRSGETGVQGVGLQTVGNKWVMTANGTHGDLQLFPPTSNATSTGSLTRYLQFAEDGTMSLMHNASESVSRGFITNANGIWMQFDKTHYMTIQGGAIGMYFGSARHCVISSSEVSLMWDGSSGVVIDSTHANLQYNANRGLFMPKDGATTLTHDYGGNKGLYINNNSIYLIWENNSGIMMTNSYYRLQWNNQCYISLNSSGIYFSAYGASSSFTSGGWK